MAQQLILHVGLHKTATSSIQHTCAANVAWLRQRGWTYPTYTMGARQYNHTRLLRNLFRRDPGRLGLAGQFAAGEDRWSDADRAQLKDKFLAAIRGDAGAPIISAEGLSTYSPEELAAVRDWLGDAYDLRVLCFVRHLTPWLNSMVAQRVRGQLALTIGEAVDELVRAGGIVRPRLETIRAVFPAAEFHSHEAAVAHPQGPAGYFLSAIGAGALQGVKWRRVNEGSSDIAVRVFSRVNERFGRSRWPGKPEELIRFFAQPGLEALRRVTGTKFRLLEHEAAPLAPLAAAENAWLRDELGDAFHDPAPRFPRSAPRPSAEEASAVRAAIRRCDPALRQYLEEALAPPTGIEPVSSA